MFNIKTAVVQSKKGSSKGKKDKVKIAADKKYVIYLVKTYSKNILSNTSMPFMITVWSIIDRRYVFTIFTNSPDHGLVEAIKNYKLKYSTVLDLRDKTEEEIKNYYGLRYGG